MCYLSLRREAYFLAPDSSTHEFLTQSNLFLIQLSEARWNENVLSQKKKKTIVHYQDSIWVIYMNYDPKDHNQSLQIIFLYIITVDAFKHPLWGG